MANINVNLSNNTDNIKYKRYLKQLPKIIFPDFPEVFRRWSL